MSTAAALADSGVVRVRNEQGPWRITLYTSREISAGNSTELAVMVQDQKTGEAVLDAQVKFSVVPPVGIADVRGDVVCGMTGKRLAWELANGRRQTVALEGIRGQSANRLMYGTSVVLPIPGDWRLLAMIERGGNQAQLDSELAVTSPGSRLRPIVGTLAIPPILIALFVLNQWLRRGNRQSAANRQASDSKIRRAESAGLGSA